MEKLIITAAICGAEVTKEQNPAVPYTVEEMVREAKSAYEAGAAILHIHVREDDGTPTQDRERFRVVMDAIRKELPDTDIVIGSVLVPDDKAPHLITKDMLRLMESGSVLVDVAIDQGGCFETSHPTTHQDPVYEIDGIVHYAVANIPGAVARTSTFALTNATIPYALKLADKGWKQACKENHDLLEGLNIVDGKVVYKGVADAWGLPYTPVEEVL